MLTPEQVTQIIAGYQAGASLRELAAIHAAPIESESLSWHGRQQLTFGPRVVEAHVTRIEGWLRGDLPLKGSVIYERLVAKYLFTVSY